MRRSLFTCDGVEGEELIEREIHREPLPPSAPIRSRLVSDSRAIGRNRRGIRVQPPRRMVGPRRRRLDGPYSVSVKLPIWNESVMTLNW